MKTILRNIILYSLILYLLLQFIPGLTINGGWMTIFMSGVALAIMFLVLRPILNVISFPVNVLTIGVFSLFTNVLILYLLTVFITDVSIAPFTYNRTEFLGVIFPTTHFNTFFAYVYTSFVLSVVEGFINWLIK